MSTDLIASEFRKVQRALMGSGCFAFQKNDLFFLYREAQPRNVLAVKAKNLHEFKRKAAIAAGVKLP